MMFFPEVYWLNNWEDIHVLFLYTSRKIRNQKYDKVVRVRDLKYQFLCLIWLIPFDAYWFFVLFSNQQLNMIIDTIFLSFIQLLDPKPLLIWVLMVELRCHYLFQVNIVWSIPFLFMYTIWISFYRSSHAQTELLIIITGLDGGADCTPYRRIRPPRLQNKESPGYNTKLHLRVRLKQGYTQT